MTQKGDLLPQEKILREFPAWQWTLTKSWWLKSYLERADRGSQCVNTSAILGGCDAGEGGICDAAGELGIEERRYQWKVTI